MTALGKLAWSVRPGNSFFEASEPCPVGRSRNRRSGGRGHCGVTHGGGRHAAAHIGHVAHAIGFLCLLPFIFRPFWPVALDNSAWVAIKQVAISDLAAMAALGPGQFALLIALLNLGLQHIGAAQAALIFSLFPLLTMLRSATLGCGPISARLGCGVLLSITGVALSCRLHPSSPALALAPGGASWSCWPAPAWVRAAACVTGPTCAATPR